MEQTALRHGPLPRPVRGARGSRPRDVDSAHAAFRQDFSNAQTAQETLSRPQLENDLSPSPKENQNAPTRSEFFQRRQLPMQEHSAQGSATQNEWPCAYGLTRKWDHPRMQQPGMPSNKPVGRLQITSNKEKSLPSSTISVWNPLFSTIH
mmetsp:Transcript_36701/g.59293  ORF Transcript_36701/g.59293 Transcript_36701/m.59293 type:complete len:150 (+) Transcript_36701:2247-2696(+)